MKKAGKNETKRNGKKYFPFLYLERNNDPKTMYLVHGQKGGNV